MSPPCNNSPFAADIRHALSHQTTMNIFDPDNGEYGKITFDILSEIAIFDMESFLNPQYWNADEMFKSDMIIKNILIKRTLPIILNVFILSFEIVNHFKPSKDVPRSTSHHPTLTPSLHSCGLFYLTRTVYFQDQVPKNGSKFGETTCEIHMDSKCD
eukprot:scaffold54812_cov58-Attheya_sp.AAC.1